MRNPCDFHDIIHSYHLRCRSHRAIDLLHPRCTFDQKRAQVWPLAVGGGGAAAGVGTRVMAGSGSPGTFVRAQSIYRLLILPLLSSATHAALATPGPRVTPCSCATVACLLFNTPGHAVYAVRICLLAARHSASQNLGAEYGAAKEGRSGGWNQ